MTINRNGSTIRWNLRNHITTVHDGFIYLRTTLISRGTSGSLSRGTGERGNVRFIYGLKNAGTRYGHRAPLRLAPPLIAYPISLLPRGLPFGIVPSSFICLKDPFVHSSSSCFTCKILYAFSTPFFDRSPTLPGAREWCQPFRRWNDDNEIFGFDDTEVNFSRTEFDTSYIEGGSAHWIDVSTYLILSTSNGRYVIKYWGARRKLD